MRSTDSARLSGWFDAYGQALVLYARQWLPADAADDVVQEVFLRLLHKWREPAQVRAWLFRSVRNAAVSELRSRQRRHKYEQRRASRQPDWFEARPDDLIDAATAQTALASLPDGQREIIVLRIWAGLTLAEAATVTGAPVSTLFSRYAAGLAALRKALEVPCDQRTT